jgi:hypothetical protein
MVYERMSGPAMGEPPGMGAAGGRRPRRAGRSALAVAAATAVGLGALTAGVVPATAAVGPNEWGYQLITPADGRSSDIHGVVVSEDMSTVVVATNNLPLPGQPADGRNIMYHTALRRDGGIWSLGPFDFRNGPQINGKRVLLTPDGSSAIYNPGGWFRVRPDGSTAPAVSDIRVLPHFVTTPDLNVLAIRANSGAHRPVYVSRNGGPAVAVSVDETGSPIHTATLGGGDDAFMTAGFMENTLSADGSSVIFSTTHAFSGDNDGGRRDVVRRVMTPGAEQTIVISDATPGTAPDGAADADYRWATADHSRIVFVTAEALDPADTDGQQDLYVRDGSAAPIRVSQGEIVDGAPTGNAVITNDNNRPEWVASSPDGNRVYFTTSERLTQDAPNGRSIYERDLAEGRTRFVAGPVATRDPIPADSRSPNMGNVRVFPGGLIFHSTAALAGARSDNLTKVFRWTRQDGLTHVSSPAPGSPASPPAAASFSADNLAPRPNHLDLEIFSGGRGVSEDGSVVFFTTTESLVPEDTDGGRKDVYRWKAGEGLRLVSPPGRAPYDSAYLDSSPDGTEVYFNTDENILPEDVDPNAKDIYLAILGGGALPSAPPPDADPVVCTGDACQGAVADHAPPAPAVGSIGFVGSGNLLVQPEPVRPTVSVARVPAVRGTVATLRVRVPGAGRITASGRSLLRTQRSPTRRGTFAVRVRLNSNGRKALRRKTQRLRVRVQYRDTNGQTATRQVRVTFQQPKAERATSRKKGR